jgi:hypothetical protein
MSYINYSVLNNRMFKKEKYAMTWDMPMAYSTALSRHLHKDTEIKKYEKCHIRIAGIWDRIQKLGSSKQKVTVELPCVL